MQITRELTPQDVRNGLGPPYEHDLSKHPNTDNFSNGKRTYFDVVQMCLTTFHGCTPADAEERILEYITGLLHIPNEEIAYGALAFTFHEEMFILAASLAGKERFDLDEGTRRAKYKNILSSVGYWI